MLLVLLDLFFGETMFILSPRSFLSFVKESLCSQYTIFLFSVILSTADLAVKTEKGINTNSEMKHRELQLVMTNTIMIF